MTIIGGQFPSTLKYNSKHVANYISNATIRSEQLPSTLIFGRYGCHIHILKNET
jgi:hypothetical protein